MKNIALKLTIKKKFGLEVEGRRADLAAESDVLDTSSF